MIIGRFIFPILVVTGAITAVPVLQFFFPRAMLKRLAGVALSEDAGLFFARHWGLVTLTLGALLIFAAFNPPARSGIVLAILVEKVGFAGLVFAHWKKLPALRVSGVFDTVCSALYLGFLLGL